MFDHLTPEQREEIAQRLLAIHDDLTRITRELEAEVARRRVRTNLRRQRGVCDWVEDAVSGAENAFDRWLSGL